jgi:membrane associated rhomboid family serine protease
MLVPISTDAPIYHFPWMTIALIVVNCVTFGLTGMGANSDGWLLQYGNGLHPLEWLAYNFLHFGPMHLLGNMFFLWAFGIVVEGKLGWWKFLAIYLGIGVVGGVLIQVAMLGYRVQLEDFARQSQPSSPSWFEPAPVFAQDGQADGPLMEDDEEMIPGENEDADEHLTPAEMEQLRQHLSRLYKPGAGGASLVVFALLGIVLIWAPKNEVTCFFMAGVRAGTFELEYLYFCGLKIASEVLGTIWGVRGFEVTSEVAHLLGAGLGCGVATWFLKANWVDCENWDLFAYAQNKHGGVSHVGSWQDAALVSHRRDRKIATPELDELNSNTDRPTKAKKRRAKSKMVALQSLDDELPLEEPPEKPIPVIEEFDERSEKKPSTASASPLRQSRSAIKEGRLNDAFAEVRRRRSEDRSFELPKAELSALAEGYFKTQNVRDSKPLLEEYIKRFPAEADRHRVKLAVLYVKYLKRPAAALKLLAAVDKATLSDDYQSIHQRAARQAQQMIADGAVDAT